MNLGLLMIVAGTALPILMIEGSWFRWIYSAGAAIALIGRIMQPGIDGGSLRLKRLSHISFWACVAFCVGAVFMWIEPETNRDWLAFTLAGGVLMIYSTVMVSRRMAKEAKEEKRK